MEHGGHWDRAKPASQFDKLTSGKAFAVLCLISKAQTNL
jgi:hypothetical protein